MQNDHLHSVICTSSSVVAAGAGAVAGTSLGTIVSRNGCMVSPSRIRKLIPVVFSCTLGAPTIPMDVLLTLRSLSCCRVSRRACRPCLIRSSNEPNTNG